MKFWKCEDKKCHGEGATKKIPKLLFPVKTMRIPHKTKSGPVLSWECWTPSGNSFLFKLSASLREIMSMVRNLLVTIQEHERHTKLKILYIFITLHALRVLRCARISLVGLAGWKVPAMVITCSPCNGGPLRAGNQSWEADRYLESTLVFRIVIL